MLPLSQYFSRLQQERCADYALRGEGHMPPSWQYLFPLYGPHW
jgi:hypothetical protein